MNLTLTRDVAALGYSYGVLELEGLKLQTLELGWQPALGAVCGRPDRSCVPAGAYKLVPHDSARHPKTWALVNPELGVYHEPADVPASVTVCRVACLLHVANFTSQLEGCIGIGRIRDTENPPAIWQSAAAIHALQDVLPWEEGHALTIACAPGITP